MPPLGSWLRAGPAVGVYGRRRGGGGRRRRAAAVVGAAAVVAAAVVVGSTTSATSRSATRPNAAAMPAESSAEVTLPRAVRLVISESEVVRLIASTCAPCTAEMAASSVAALPSSRPSESTTITLCSASGLNCWLAVMTAS